MWATPDSYDIEAQRPKATHLTILLGANDASDGGRPNGAASVSWSLSLSLRAQLTQRVFSVPPAQFQENYLTFLTRLRESFAQPLPIFLLNSWGWPSADAPPSPWFSEVYPAVVAEM